MPCVARMAKLADAADLKSADRKVMGVQIPLRAPVKCMNTINLHMQDTAAACF